MADKDHPSRIIKFYTGPDEYARIAQSQKRHVRDWANAIESGKLVEGRIERGFIAAILRLWADNLPENPKGKQGPPPRFCHGSEALSYAANRCKGMTHGEAIVEIADRVDVSEVAVNKAIQKYRDAAFAFIGFPDPGNQ